MNDQNPPIERIWKCAWHEGDYWFDHKQGEVHPEIIPLFPSHGICDKCLQKQKAILAAMKESNNFRVPVSGGSRSRDTGGEVQEETKAIPCGGLDAANSCSAEIHSWGEPVPIDFNHFGAA